MVFVDYEAYGVHIAFDVFHIPEVVAEEVYVNYPLPEEVGACH